MVLHPCYAGMTDELLGLLSVNQLDGLMTQALALEIPKETAEKLKSLSQAGLPIALVSRCFNGIAEPGLRLRRRWCLQNDGAYKRTKRSESATKASLQLTQDLKVTSSEHIWKDKKNPMKSVISLGFVFALTC